MSAEKEKPKVPVKPAPAAKPRAAREPLTALPLWARLPLSLLVTWHLFVVFISPVGIDRTATSDFVWKMVQSPVVAWYGDPLYLRHGYHFFAPEPAVNHIVRYRIFDSGGQVTSEGEFPSLKSQWPRLHYHRHMMLADQVVQGPPPAEPQLIPLWEQDRRATLTAYARHLLRVNQGERIELRYLLHNVLLPSQVLANLDPNDPRTFVEEITPIVVTKSDLERPIPGLPVVSEPVAPAAIPDPTGGGS